MPARDGLEEEEGVCEEALLASQRVAIETEHVSARLARVLLPYLVVVMPMMRAALFFFEFLDDGAYGLRAPENKLLHAREERGVHEVSDQIVARLQQHVSIRQHTSAYVSIRQHTWCLRGIQ